MYLRNSKYFLERIYLSHQVRRCSTNVESKTAEEKVELADEKVKRDEEEITRLRDVSRLPAKLKGRMKHIPEPHPFETQSDCITKFKRRKTFNNLLYASYGRKSGIDPSYFWMNEEQLKEQIEFEEEWEPPLSEKLKVLREKEETERLEMQEKDELMVAQMKKMPGLIKEYQTRLRKEGEKESEMQKKKQALLDEAREFFGYNISPFDPRFEQMKLQKEEEEKKGKKLLKKNKKLESM